MNATRTRRKVRRPGWHRGIEATYHLANVVALILAAASWAWRP